MTSGPASSCAYCGAEALEPGSAEGVLQCRACGRSSLASAVRTGALDPSPPDPDDARGEGPRRALARGAPGEVASWPAALAALVVTVIFYAGLYAAATAPLPLAPVSRLADLFLARGWVPYVITAVAAWALLLLAARAMRLRWQRRALDRPLVSPGPDGRIGPADAPAALASLHARSGGVEDSFLVAKLERALRHFESRRSVVEVIEYLSAEGNADEGRVDASYALVRVFVWVVPTLGFIGTVLGIGAAVAGFSETLEAASSLEGMKESIGSVTGGLGIAFDTTLLALVMSILIMFPASAVQRSEENLLAEVEDYCAEELVRRLRDDPRDAAEDDAIDRLAERLAERLESSSAAGRRASDPARDPGIA